MKVYSPVTFQRQLGTHPKKGGESSGGGMPICSTYSAWGKRSVWAVPGSGAVQTDVTVKFVVQWRTGMAADFRDLGFSNYDGTVLGKYLWDYISGDWAVVHIKFPTLPATGTLVQMYYDGSTVANAAISDVYDSNNTFDGFGSGPGLPTNLSVDSGESSSVSVVGGELVMIHPSTDTVVLTSTGLPAGLHVIEWVLKTTDLSSVNIGLIGVSSFGYYINGGTQVLYGGSDSDNVAILSDTGGILYYRLSLVRNAANGIGWLTGQLGEPFPITNADQISVCIAGGGLNKLTSAGILDSASNVFIKTYSTLHGTFTIAKICAYKATTDVCQPALAWEEEL